MKSADRIQQASRWICVRPDIRQLLEEAGLGSLELLTSRGIGEPITDRRSSWVRLVSIGSTQLYIKTYDYPDAGDRWRGMLRNTFLRPSRARREGRALSWLRERGFDAPEPVAVLEKRRGGFLYRAVLITRAWPGHPLHRLLPVVGQADRLALLDAVRRYVTGLHAAGFRDRNLDLRNLLARRSDAGEWVVAKIDSPRFKITSAGRRSDRAARSDLRRLDESLRSCHAPAAH